MTASEPTPTRAQQPLLRSRDVADLLGMSREQVWRLWSAGRLPGYRFDRNLRFAPADLDEFMAKHYCTPSTTREPAAHARPTPRPSTQYRRL